MTTASLGKDIEELIERHNVWRGAVINALTGACEGRDYLTAEDIKRLIDNYEMRRKER